MKIASFSQAKHFIYQHISADPKLRFAGEFGLRRGAYLLKLLGDPQNKLNVIHIAGTSGKGSTAFYISNLLKSLGFKVSLTLSPHLVDIRERIQINNLLIPKKEFVETLNRIMPVILKMEKTQFGQPSYFEILIAMFFYVSLKNSVDYAIVETGLGGIYDGTNTVTRKDKICVITKIGFDHMEVLGNSLEEIAGQKAGIIQSHNKVLTIWQDRKVREVFEKKVKEKKGKLFFIKEGRNYKNIRLIDNKINFDFKYGDFSFKDICLKTNAFYQIENASLALATVFYLSKRDNFLAREKILRKCLGEVSFGGRMETFNIKGKTIIVDGAHNPQKMKSFIDSLKKVYPKEKFSFLIAVREGKDFENMINYIIPVSAKIFITSYTVTNYDMIHHSTSPSQIARFLTKKGFNNYRVVKDAKQALKELVNSSSKKIVITGSFYLLSQIYPPGV